MASENYETILILGAGIMQTPAIKEAKSMGFHVVVADANPRAPGIKMADEFAEIDLKDHRKIAAEAVRLRKEQNLTAVFTAGTDFSTTAAYAATAAGLPGIDYSAALSASNKILMRRAFHEAGVPSPAFYPVSNTEEAVEAAMKLEFPIVIKPVDSMGARGVVKIEDPDDRKAIIKAAKTAAAASRSGEAIVEEFIDGSEFSLDALVIGGEVTICGFADRHIYFPPYFVEMGHTMPAQIPKEIREEIEEVFIKGIHSLGITTGAAKGDMKYSRKKGAMVGEIAARLSGGFMSGWTYPYHSGIVVTAEAIKIAAGRPPGSLEPVLNHVSAERAAISIPGRIVSVEGVKAAENTEYVKNVFISAEAGDQAVFPVNNVQKCANCISAAEDRDLSVNAAEEAVRELFFRLEPGNRETADFIERKTYRWAPDAFVLTNKENLELLSRAGSDDEAVLPSLEKEAALDWHGCGVKPAFIRVKQLCGCSDAELTKGFWNAFLRGGIQGGVWYIESARKKNSGSTDES